ncbi:MAG: AraC family transcriptional regulator [Acidobacteriia bacterium]|nr:AraC family transcriptional regulator [Terriglobia bacterium]
MSYIHQDHSARPIGRDERARIWRHGALRGTELFQGSYRKYEFAHHFHSVPAIGIVERGSMSCYCRGETHVLPAGTVLLLNPGEVHAPGPAHSHEWSLRVFFFEDEQFRLRSADLARDALRFSKPFVQDRRLATSLLRLHRKLETQGTELDLESSTLEVFTQLARRHSCVPVQVHRSGIGKFKIKRVKDYLNAHYRRDITLDDLSAVAQLSPYHLLRTFRSSVGLTPHAYLIQIRIEEGKRLLRMGNSISDVSASTGFTDQSHFTRHFKRIMGVTPGQYLPRLQGA